MFYNEVGHSKGGAMKWVSQSSCNDEVLGGLIELAVQDTPGTNSVFREDRTIRDFAQRWPAPDGWEGYPQREIDYSVTLASDADGATVIEIYAEALLMQTGGGVTSVEFDDEFKARVKQYMSALFVRAKDCGLATNKPIRFG